MLITVLSGVKGDTRRYRSFHLYEQLQLAGVDCLLSHITDPQLPGKLAHADVVIFHRTALDGYVSRLIDSVHRRGGLVLSDVDDLVFDPSVFEWIDSPDFQDPVRAALYKDEMHRHQAALQACDGVIASTEFLAGQVRSLGKPAWVHRNAFSLEMLSLANRALSARRSVPDRVVIGYASGTPTHDRDFEQAVPALRRVLLRYPYVALWLVGPLDPGRSWDGLETRIHRQPLVPWRRLPEIVAQFDINLAPLVARNPFGQSKSEIKYMEAALVQTPTVASFTQAYHFAIRSAQNGFLVDNDQEWEAALSLLVEQSEKRQSMGEQAYRHVLEHYHPRVRAGQIVELLHQICGDLGANALQEALPHAAGPSIPESVKGYGVAIEFEAQPGLAQMALYTLQHRGPGVMFKQLWVYFRRLLARFFPYQRAR